MQIEKPATLDLLDISKPALSATTDMPVIETKPDSTPAPKAKDEKAALPEKAAEKAAESAPAEAKATQPDDSSASDETDGEPHKPKARGVQKRIDELTRQREDERRARESMEQNLNKALAAIERLTGKPAAEAKQELEEKDPEPQRPVKGQFADDTAFEAARDKYTEEKAGWIARREIATTIAERDRQVAEARIVEETERARTTYRDRVAKVQEKYEDYSEVAESPDVKVTVPMARAILDSEFGPELQYFLGKNPAESERISKLSIPQQLLALGRLEASFSAPAAQKSETPAPAEKPAPAKPAVSNAPPPVKTVKAGSESEKPLEELSMEEYAARRKGQMVRRPGARL